MLLMFAHQETVWKNVAGFGLMHLIAFYGVYILFTRAHIYTFIWGGFLTYLVMLGIPICAHRLYTHRSFQATAPLRVFLLMCQALAGQNCCYIWVRDHRQHHKYCDTNADPHNSTRGFFFAHMGWLMTRKHPDVIKYGKTIDMSDLEADPYVMFQKKYFMSIYFIVAIFIPVAVPCYFWHESFFTTVMTAYALRYVLSLNVTWLVNSAAHLYGTKPYDKNITPREMPLVSYLTGGEGWHNFHHAYPWDYRASEFGPDRYNVNACFIELCEKLGLASDLRSVSKSVLEKKVVMTGDGSHPVWGHGY